MSNKLITGHGGKSGSGQEDPNTLQSKAKLRLLGLISEGPIEGFPDTDLSKYIYANNIPLKGDDNRYNYDGLSYAYRAGLPTQDYISGFTDGSSQVNLGDAEVSHGTPYQFVISQQADSAILTIAIPALYDARADKGPKKTSVSFTIHVKSASGSFVLVHSKSLINQKTVSRYEEDFSIPLPAGGAPWTVKVTKNTQDPSVNEQTKFQNSILAARYQPIVEGKFSYRNRAVLGISIDAEQFGANSPNFKVKAKGIKVWVPKNYNPITRTYSATGAGTSNGTWDGTFKSAWSNNPAWVLFDILTNNRYGLGNEFWPLTDPNQLINGPTNANIDRWSLYVISQYCDGLVTDGYGGLEPRYTINAQLKDRMEAYNLIVEIMASFRGMMSYSNGQLGFTMDKDDSASFIFNQTNVIDGLFNYASSSQRVVYSVCIVKWNDPNMFGEVQQEVYEDPALLAKYGYRPVEFTALGCSSRAMAHRLAKWKLLTEKLQGEILSFSIGQEGKAVFPGAIIDIYDSYKSGARAGGRVSSYVNNTTTATITVDSYLDIDLGQSPYFLYTDTSGALQQLPITAKNSTNRTYTITGLIDTDIPEFFIYAVSWNSLKPQKYRVLTVSENADDDTYTVTALKHDPNKYALIEQGLVLDPPITTVISQLRPLPPSEIISQQWHSPVLGSESDTRITASWSRVTDANVIKYELQLETTNEPYRVVYEGMNTTWTTESLLTTTSEEYIFRVRSVDRYGKYSEWATSTPISATGNTSTPTSPTNLQYRNAGKVSELSWANPQLSDYRYTEVWVNSSNNLGTATLLTTISGDFYTYAHSDYTTQYFWLRTVTNSLVSNTSSATSVITITPSQISSSDIGSVSWSSIDSKPANIENLTGLERIVGDELNPNPRFDIWPDGQIMPSGFSRSAFTPTKYSDGSGNSIDGMVSDGSSPAYVYTVTSPVGSCYAGQKFLGVCEFTLIAGTFGSSDNMTLFPRNAAGTVISGYVYQYFRTSRLFDITANAWVTAGDGVIGHRYRMEIPITFPNNTDVSRANLYLSIYANSTANIRLHELYYRPMVNLDINLADSVAAINAISSDSVLSKGEKPNIKKDFDAIVAEYAPITAQADKLLVTKTAYVNAYNALYTYITALSPSYADYTQDTAIVGVTFNQKFVDYYNQKSAILAALAGGLAPQILSASQSYTKNSKMALYSNATGLADYWTNTYTINYSVLRTTGLNGNPWSIDITTNDSANCDIQQTNLKGRTGGDWVVAEIDFTLVSGNLNGTGFYYYKYLVGGSAVTSSFNLATTTDINGNVAGAGVVGTRYKFQKLIDLRDANLDYYRFIFMVRHSAFSPVGAVRLQIHQLELRPATDAEIQTEKSRQELANIANDSILSKGEKPSVLKEWNAIVGETNSISAQAASLSVDDSTRVTAYNNLASYLGGLTPSWTDYAQDTPINSTTFGQKFNDYYTAKQNVLAAISSKLIKRDGIGLETPNAGFDDWPIAANFPTQWQDWWNATARKVRRDDGLGGFALGLPALVGDNYCGVVHSSAIGARPNSYIVLEGRLKLESGQFHPTTQFYATVYNAAYTNASYIQILISEQKEADGSLIGNGVVGRTYKFAKVFKLDATYFNLQVFCMNVYSGTALTVGNDITWLEHGWRYATEQEIRTFNMEDGADKTANQVPTLSSNINVIDIQCDYQGAALSGQLPKTINFTRKKGNTDVSATTTWTIVGNPTATCSINSSGVLSISAISGSTTIVVKSSRDGVDIELSVQANKILAAPPNTGSGGTTVQDTSFNGVSGTSHVAISDEMTVKTGANGQIAFSGDLGFALVSTVSGSANCYVKWQYKAVGGTYADVAGEVVSDYPSVCYPDNFEPNEDGSVVCSPVKTGLTPNTDYIVKLMARRALTTPSGTIYFYGTAMAVGS